MLSIEKAQITGVCPNPTTRVLSNSLGDRKGYYYGDYNPVCSACYLGAEHTWQDHDEAILRRREQVQQRLQTLLAAAHVEGWYAMQELAVFLRTEWADAWDAIELADVAPERYRIVEAACSHINWPREEWPKLHRAALDALAYGQEYLPSLRDAVAYRKRYGKLPA